MMHTQKVCINHFMDQLKVCSKCKESKAHSEFHKDRFSKDGLRHLCKVCSKVYYDANKDKISERHKGYYEANKNKKKAYRDANKDRAKSYNKAYWDANKIRLNKQKLKYAKIRYHTDPEYRAIQIIRRQIRKLIKSLGLKKDKRSIELLGVSWTEAYSRLLKTLPEGYTEQDWLDGKLHIDHKIPMSWFKRLHGTITEDLMKRINHISNLQLIPKEQNISKGDRYGHGINNEIILYEDWVITEQLSTVSH